LVLNDGFRRIRDSRGRCCGACAALAVTTLGFTFLGERLRDGARLCAPWETARGTAALDVAGDAETSRTGSTGRPPPRACATVSITAGQG